MNRAQMDKTLARLWDRCSSKEVSEADWQALYVHVAVVLMACSAPELGGLPDERRAYVDSYFTEKVFLAM
jgi:hypothetical protein